MDLEFFSLTMHLRAMVFTVPVIAGLIFTVCMLFRACPGEPKTTSIHRGGCIFQGTELEKILPVYSSNRFPSTPPRLGRRYQGCG